MGAVELLERCEAAGLRISANGDRLRVSGPKHAERLVAELRVHKAEVLRLLVRIEPVEDDGRTRHRLVRASDGRPLGLGLCISADWARFLAAEHGLRVTVDEPVP